MAFEELKENTENIQDEAQAYIESNIAYYKLKSFKVAMKLTTLIFKFAFVFLFFLIVLMFFSVAGALAIGKTLDNYVFGFLIIGGVYLVISIIVFLFKDKIIEEPILEKFSEIFFND
ncbi:MULTISPECIES: competence protein [unclassified Flavobacterium]|jgi:uncharacterized membrane protein YagU involved in acid resistance|uniref:competence protein n=1 Tax=unclassified Flavobacterium TaxID=196869 RepID=UPI0025B962B6|nr:MULTISPECIES: competence protein [unclassified Flavobacterium]